MKKKPDKTFTLILNILADNKKKAVLCEIFETLRTAFL